MKESPLNAHPHQAGRGLIGFLIAFILVIFGGYCLRQFYFVKSRADQLNDYVYEAIKDAERSKLSEEDVRFNILKKIRELQIPGDAGKQLRLTRDAARWQAHLEWDDEVVFPGYTYKWHHVVDHTWTRY